MRIRPRQHGETEVCQRVLYALMLGLKNPVGAPPSSLKVDIHAIYHIYSRQRDQQRGGSS